MLSSVPVASGAALMTTGLGATAAFVASTPAPVDCQVSGWETKTPCPLCGTGSQVLRPVVTQEAQYGGKACPEDRTVECEAQPPCPVDCQYTWKTTTRCPPCGTGTQVVSPEVTQDAMYGGQPCPTARSEECQGLPPCAEVPTRGYRGNNGSVDGHQYCAGRWGSPGNKTNKNLKCTMGYTIQDPRGKAFEGKAVSCDSTMVDETGRRLGHWGYLCSSPNVPRMYRGNDGTVTGHQFCQGHWGSADRMAKNKRCVMGVTIKDPRGAQFANKTVSCDDQMSRVAGKKGHWAYYCE